ncbi:unannotated protein [freshwater metagenome]|uniref:Unannotated protein n=1 Tax=freshwater metagenome TaxID=449393 RepID=A0A6J6SS80_9ZZZZ|nr:hypothetical protein [Actinomycetota bacterium]MSX16631.1 hypothetical protein [Actinomycetota bacterium]MSX37355.1 hypothetical protein [Actinomycetota bacterium]MSZ72679.1 hypothetical protein [Actinomycetota bacterium]MUH57442.1 hypothetical protein [Actinomycetota bacterium]
MITTSSKLFYGLGAVAIAAAIVWTIASDGGSGAVALVFIAIASIFLGAIASYVRDGHVLSTDTAQHDSAPAAQRGPGRSWFPLGTALSLGMVVVGLVTSPGIFKVGIALLLAMLGEWLIQNWSDRASSDVGYNARVRGWVVHPLEIPIGGALLLAAIVLSFSRIFLALSVEAGPIVFAILGALVLFFGSVLSIRRGTSARVVGAACGVVLLALSAVGVALALNGEREELTVAAAEDHFAERPCGEEAEVADESPIRAVSAKSSIAATVTLKDGVLYAEMDGFSGPLTSITLQRSLNLSILFQNEDEGEHRMVLTYGKTVEDLGGGVMKETELQACTSLVTEGGQQVVVVNIPKPSYASAEPFSISVTGVEGASIEVMVP